MVPIESLAYSAAKHARQASTRCDWISRSTLTRVASARRPSVCEAMSASAVVLEYAAMPSFMAASIFSGTCWNAPSCVGLIRR
jgi:hypothetical protein